MGVIRGKNKAIIIAYYDVQLLLHTSMWYCVLECGGKMHLREGEYEKAHTDFFEAFKNYDESGSPRFVVKYK